MMKVEIIENCPSCDSLLEEVNGQLFCRATDCPAKSSRQILHFAKTMKIKGLGERTIEKLNITSITDIYCMPLVDITDCIGEKLGLKLYDEINKSKVQKLDVYLSSFGIPLIGTTASRKVAAVVQNITEISPELCKKAGLGEKATSNLMKWLDNNSWLVDSLPITIEESSDEQPSEDLGLTVCITGKLNGFTRSSAEAHLTTKGITCVSGVSKKVDFLICNDVNSLSSKAVKARNLGITIIPFENFLKENNLI